MIKAKIMILFSLGKVKRSILLQLQEQLQPRISCAHFETALCANSNYDNFF